MTKTIKLTVQGDVQEVGFRYATCQKASELKITGWVKNESDGSVSTLIQGSEAATDSMVRWLHKGPPFANVTKLVTRPSDDASTYTRFDIVY